MSLHFIDNLIRIMRNFSNELSCSAVSSQKALVRSTFTQPHSFSNIESNDHLLKPKHFLHWKQPWQSDMEQFDRRVDFRWIYIRVNLWCANKKCHFSEWIKWTLNNNIKSFISIHWMKWRVGRSPFDFIKYFRKKNSSICDKMNIKILDFVKYCGSQWGHKPIHSQLLEMKVHMTSVTTNYFKNLIYAKKTLSSLCMETNLILFEARKTLSHLFMKVNVIS